MREILFMYMIVILIISVLALIHRAIEIVIFERRTRRMYREMSEREASKMPPNDWIPEPDDIVVAEVAGSFMTNDNKRHNIHQFNLYCKSRNRCICSYATRTEAEAARLQFMHDHCEVPKNKFEL